MKNALAAVQFLTIASRLPRSDFDPERLGKAAFYFPLVGMFLGSLLLGLEWLLEPYLASEILSVVLVAVLASATGGVHFEGLQRTFDGLLGRSAETSSGAVGLLAILFVVMLKIRSLEVTGETRSLALLLSPMIARWTLLIFLYGAAEVTLGSAKAIAANVRAGPLVGSTLVTLSIAAFLIGRSALWIGFYLSVFALLSRSLFLRRNRPIGNNHFGGVVELSETLSFIAFSLF